MPQKALSEAGGEAFMLATRFPREQAARVAELAREAGLTRSAFLRKLVARELEQRAETEGRAPPDPG